MEQNTQWNGAIDEWYEVPPCPSQIKEKQGGGGEQTKHFWEYKKKPKPKTKKIKNIAIFSTSKVVWVVVNHHLTDQFNRSTTSGC